MNRQARLFVVAAVMLMGLSVVGCSKDKTQARVTVRGASFNVEIADTPATQTVGLGGRSSLAADEGMLFVFPTSATRTFHMKDCYFPIDIAFIDEDGVIVNLTTMPVEADPAHPRLTYDSYGPARYVLETFGGTWARIGAVKGDRITFTSVFDDR